MRRTFRAKNGLEKNVKNRLYLQQYIFRNTTSTLYVSTKSDNKFEADFEKKLTKKESYNQFFQIYS